MGPPSESKTPVQKKAAFVNSHCMGAVDAVSGFKTLHRSTAFEGFVVAGSIPRERGLSSLIECCHVAQRLAVPYVRAAETPPIPRTVRYFPYSYGCLFLC